MIFHCKPKALTAVYMIFQSKPKALSAVYDIVSILQRIRVSLGRPDNLAVRVTGFITGPNRAVLMCGSQIMAADGKNPCDVVQNTYRGLY